MKSFITDHEPPKINELIKDIEAKPEYEEAVLSSLKERVWGSLCGFTHGGFLQVSWRVTENEITSTFSEGHLVSLLMTSCALSLQAYIAMSILVNDDNLANAIKEAHQNIFGYAEWHNK